MATFILVHGACHGGWCWEKVTPILEGHGHKVCAPDLPGLGKDQTPPASVTLADNVERISRLLDKMEEPVVLVGGTGEVPRVHEDVARVELVDRDSQGHVAGVRVGQ